MIRHAIRLFSIIPILIAMGLPPVASAVEVTLAWDPNPETDLAGYRVHYGLQTRQYDLHIDVGNRTRYTVTGLGHTQPVFFAVTAYNTQGAESACSNEVVFWPIFSEPPDGPIYVNPKDSDCGGKSPCYPSIQQGIDGASDGACIHIAQGTYKESPTLSAPKTVTLKGGWNADFSQQAPDTTFIGLPSVSGEGTLNLQNVIIKP